MSAPAFSFTKLVVADLAAAERFYCDVFGLEVRHRHTADEHAYGQEESILSGVDAQGSIPLILTRYLRRPTPAAGGAWTGFTVADIEATAEAIERAGGRIEVPVHSAPSHPVKALVASDPEGHMIEVIQMVGEG
jgi:predicted enzyme related to lactoylglutathione lyase